MLTKCQGYLIFNWETLILVNVLKDQELAVPTSAFISTDILETVYEKKSDVICSSFPPRCGAFGCFRAKRLRLRYIGGLVVAGSGLH